MREFIVSEKEAGIRFDKFLYKLLPNAGSGIIFKSIRKKNIVLNGKKAEGNELLTAGDTIKIFFSEDTFDKFMDKKSSNDIPVSSLNIPEPSVIFENNDILVLNKPCDLLSQKASKDDVTLTEWVQNYVGCSDAFTAGVCNRLDRNTSGIVLAGKSIKGLQELSALIKDRKISKFYLTCVVGEIKEKKKIEGYLVKKEQHNTVTIYDEPVPESAFIKTEYEPLQVCNGYSLLKVNLITGKSHQIRAHLASIGHPVMGDGKYGFRRTNEMMRRYGLKYQLLHSYEVVFPDECSILSANEPHNFKAELPAASQKVLSALGFKTDF